MKKNNSNGPQILSRNDMKNVLGGFDAPINLQCGQVCPPGPVVKPGYICVGNCTMCVSIATNVSICATSVSF